MNEYYHWRHVVRTDDQVAHGLQEVEELRTRVREGFRVDPVVSADDVLDRVELGIVAGEAVENQVPPGDVSLRRLEEVAVFKPFFPEVVDLSKEGEFNRADGVR